MLGDQQKVARLEHGKQRQVDQGSQRQNGIGRVVESGFGYQLCDLGQITHLLRV
jgi:hypothetical protein